MSCGNGLERDIDVLANAPAGDTSTVIEDLPVGTVCTVTEPTNGSSAGVSVTTDIVGSPATITAEEVGVGVTNTYEEPNTPDTPSSSDTGVESSTSSGSGGDLASTGASAGLGLMAALGVALLVGAGAFLSASHRRHGEVTCRTMSMGVSRAGHIQCRDFPGPQRLGSHSGSQTARTAPDSNKRLWPAGPRLARPGNCP